MKPSVTTAQGKLIAIADDGYPVWLRAIPNPPAALYCDGLVEPRDRQAIAIVGARKATPYGLRVTETRARTERGRLHDRQRIGAGH